METIDERFEYIQSFLIVDERIINTSRISGIHWTNLIITIALLSSFVIILPIVLEFQGFWIVFAIGLSGFIIFYALQSRREVIYFVTKFRIIELEINPIIDKFSRNPLTGSFRDIHYNQVESIYHGPSRYNANRLWAGMFMVSLAWALSLGQGAILNGDSPLLPLIILLVILGIINIFISFPVGGKKLEIRSQSGSSFSIQSSAIDSKFIDDVIDASRTFQTYGAI